MVDKNGVWAKSGFGLTNGWIYAAKTPGGPLAYWTIAEDGLEVQINDGEQFISWWALNDEAFSLSRSAMGSAGLVNEADVNRMLTDQIRSGIAHCLGY